MQTAKISTGGVKKGRNIGLKIITANRLTDGVVIYFTENHQWTEDIQKAIKLEGDNAMQALAIATAQESDAVGPYLMDIAEGVDSTMPDGRGRIREEIRLNGPTVISAYM